jgi:hypothetical protein
VLSSTRAAATQPIIQRGEVHRQLHLFVFVCSHLASRTAGRLGAAMPQSNEVRQLQYFLRKEVRRATSAKAGKVEEEVTMFVVRRLVKGASASDKELLSLGQLPTWMSDDFLCRLWNSPGMPVVQLHGNPGVLHLCFPFYQQASRSP